MAQVNWPKKETSTRGNKKKIVPNKTLTSLVINKTLPLIERNLEDDENSPTNDYSNRGRCMAGKFESME